jgi:hypothetical protein
MARATPTRHAAVIAKAETSPPPPSPTARRWRRRFAAHLLDQYRRLPKRRGAKMSRAEVALRYEALDLIEEMGAPAEVLALFDALLGGIVAEWDRTAPGRRWIPGAVAYEARALAAGRRVTDSEIVDAVVMKMRGRKPSRAAALKEVRATRRADFYRAFVMTRQWEAEKAAAARKRRATR